MEANQARAKRHRRLLLIASMVYVPAVLVARTLPSEPASLQWLGMAPAFLAGLAMFHFAVQSVRFADELQRLQSMEAIAFGFLGVAVLTFSFAVLPVPVPSQIRWIDVWVLLSAFWLVGWLVAYIRHR